MSRPALARVNRILYEQRDQYPTYAQAQALFEEQHARQPVWVGWGEDRPFEGIHTDYHTDEDESDEPLLYPRCHKCKPQHGPCRKCKHKVDSNLTKDERIQPQPICPALWANPTVGAMILRSRQLQKQKQKRDPRWLRNQPVCRPSTAIRTSVPPSLPPASLQ